MEGFMRHLLLLSGLLIIFMTACDAGTGFGEDEVPPDMSGATAVSQTTTPDPTPIPESSESTPPTTPTAVDKWSLWVDGPHLRGMDMHPCVIVNEDGCVQAMSRQDMQELRDLGANLINASYPGLFSEEPPYEVNPTALAYLDDLVGWAEEIGFYVVIHFRTGPGRNEGAITGEGDPLFAVWTEPEAHDAWVEMWRFTADRYRNSPAVAGYDLMVEPHPNSLIDPNYELEPAAAQAQMAGTLLDWNAFAAEMTVAIRQVDPDTPIIVNSLSWGSAEWFAALEPTGDPRTIYSLHAYDPDIYVIQEEGETNIRYPDVVDAYSETITFDRAWLEENYRPVRQFAQQHNVPIYVGEFGALRWIPDATAFLSDQMDLFEQYGWNYAVYVWRGDEPDFDGFNLEYGPDPANHVPILDNPLLTIFRDRWAANVDLPGTAVAGTDNAELPEPALQTGLPALANVDHWLYLIDVNLELDVVDQIAASTYDMVVLDFIASEENNTDYPMAGVVAQLHQAAHPKLAIAYIDIGQAENYRTYWQPGWGIGNPEWIITGDPDGWEGNFPVAYWYEEWQRLWLNEETGYLQAILDAGFDGVYLDWVEAYSDEDVAAFAIAAGIDARQEMIYWVEEIAEYGRAQNPNFIIIGQNAAELAQSDYYADIVDAIAQEQVWFDGGADNEPPGDCPLPRADDDIDSDAYYDSLSPACRQQFDAFPESTLHVSSEGYLRDLTLAQSKELTIFTVDYALEPDNVAWVYETARGLGFIPFVGSRALDQFVAAQ